MSAVIAKHREFDAYTVHGRTAYCRLTANTIHIVKNLVYVYIHGLKMSILIYFKEVAQQMAVLQYRKPGASNTIQLIVNGRIPIFAYRNILLQP